MKPYRVLPVLVAVLCGACRDSSGGKTQGTLFTDGLITTATDAAFVPEGFGVTNARFAIADDGSIVAPPGGDILIVVQLISTDGDFCDATFRSAGPLVPQGWSQGTSAVLGWDHDGTAPTGSCGSVDLPTAWGDGLSVIGSWTWGIGIAPAPTTEVEDRLDPSDREALAPYLLGAGMHLPGIDDDDGVPGDISEWQPNAYAWGVDANGDYIDADALIVGGDLQPAVYEVQAPSLLTPARALLF
jgi:hypothetical protein